MAIRVWGGGTNDHPTNDMSVANNYSGDAVPVNGDSLIFNGVEGQTSPTAGMNTLAAVNLAELVVTDDFTGSIGATANHLQVNDVGSFRYSGSGAEAWFQINGTCDVGYILNTASGANACRLDTAGAGTISALYCFKGVICLDAPISVGTLYVHYNNAPSTDVGLTIAAGVFLNNVHQHGGEVSCSADFGVGIQSAGQWTQEAGDIVEFYCYGGQLYWNAPAGTLGRAEMRGGTLIGSDDPRARTITDLYVWYGAQADLRNSAANIVVTNPVPSLGGWVWTEPGQQVTFA